MVTQAKTKSSHPARDNRADLLHDLGSVAWAWRGALPGVIDCERLLSFVSWCNVQWFEEPVPQDAVRALVATFCESES